VNIALDGLGASSAAKGAFASLRKYMEQVRNPQLQFVAFVPTSMDDAGGQDTGLDAAHRLIALYGKKAATDTDVYLYAFDDATNDAGAGTDGRANLVFLESGKEAWAIYPTGIPMVDGLVIKAYTDFDGTTDSTDTDCPNGFALVAAATFQ
jgi:hypothetical protein